MYNQKLFKSNEIVITFLRLNKKKTRDLNKTYNSNFFFWFFFNKVRMLEYLFYSLHHLETVHDI